MVMGAGIFPWFYSPGATHLTVTSTGYEHTQLSHLGDALGS